MVPVPPLPLRAADSPATAEGLEGSGAVRLFVARARAADPGFALDESNAAAVAEICRRLDGLPLAIELAAAWIPVLPPSAMLARLQRRLPQPTGGARDLPERQQTMRAAVAWSYDLIAPAEQAGFQRLAAFAGSFDLAAAGAVAAGETGGDALAAVAALVDKSLLCREDGSGAEPRFAMLETVREFGVDRLAASGEEAQTRAAHAGYFLRLAEVAEHGLIGPEQAAWQRRLGADLPNLRGALAWATERDQAMALRLATALWRFWWAHPAEGLAWLERALAGAAVAPAPLRAKALGAASILASYRGDAKRGAALAREALALAEAGGDRAGRACGLVMLSFAERYRGDHAASALHTEAAAAISDNLGEGPWFSFLAAGNLLRLGHEAYERGDWSRAEAALGEALRRWRRLGSPWGIGVALVKLADVASARGDGARAGSLFRESLDHWEVLRRELAALEVLAGLARLAATRQPEVAVRLLAAMDALQAQAGLVTARALRDQMEATLAAARIGLGEGRFRAAWIAGQALSDDEVLREAKAAADPAPPSPPTHDHGRMPATHSLTPRALAVLRLLADGRTDKEIAEALSLSPRTVNHHVASLLAKLGVANRAEATSAARAAGLLPWEASVTS